MNTQERKEALWRLLIDDEMDKVMSPLVRSARGLVENLFNTQPGHGLERSQLSNLVAATLETESVEVVRAFIQYQVGRDDRRRNWRAGRPFFGEKVLETIDDYRSQAQGLISKVAREMEVELDNKEAKVEQVWMLFVRRLAGYLERAFVYEKYRAEQQKKGE